MGDDVAAYSLNQFRSYFTLHVRKFDCEQAARGGTESFEVGAEERVLQVTEREILCCACDRVTRHIDIGKLRKLVRCNDRGDIFLLTSYNSINPLFCARSTHTPGTGSLDEFQSVLFSLYTALRRKKGKKSLLKAASLPLADVFKKLKRSIANGNGDGRNRVSIAAEHTVDGYNGRLSIQQMEEKTPAIFSQVQALTRYLRELEDELLREQQATMRSKSEWRETAMYYSTVQKKIEAASASEEQLKFMCSEQDRLIHALEADLQTIELKREIQLKTLQNSRTEVRERKTQFDALFAVFVGKQREVEESTIQFEIFEKQTGELTRSIEREEVMRKDLEEKGRLTGEDARGKSSLLAQAQKELLSKDAQRSVLTAELNELKEQHRQLEMRCVSVRTDVEKSREHSEREKESLKSLREQRRKQEAQLEFLSNQCSSHRIDIGGKAEKLSIQRADSEYQKSEFQNDIAQLQSQTADKQERIRKLEKDKVATKDNIAQILSEIDSLQKMCDQKKSQAIELETVILSKDERIQAITKELQNVNQASSQSKSEAHVKERHLHILENEVLRCQTAEQAKRERYEQLLKQRAGIAESGREHRVELLKKQTLLQVGMGEIQARELQSLDLARELTEMQATISTLRTAMRQISKNVAKKQVDGLSEMESMYSITEAKKEETAEIHKKLHVVQKQLNKLGNRLQEKDLELPLFLEKWSNSVSTAEEPQVQFIFGDDLERKSDINTDSDRE